MFKLLSAVLIFGFAAPASADVFSGGRAAFFEAIGEAKVPAVTFADIEKADTSGCSVQAQRRQAGKLSVTANPVPARRCWNIDGGGLLAEYTWLQQGRIPALENIGFWLSLNGAEQYKKASGYSCRPADQLSYGHDTSGRQYFACTARARFDFGASPSLLTFAYAPSGQRNAWDVQAAVSLDDAGNWDSLEGKNYRFRF